MHECLPLPALEFVYGRGGGGGGGGGDDSFVSPFFMTN